MMITSMLYLINSGIIKNDVFILYVKLSVRKLRTYISYQHLGNDVEHLDINVMPWKRQPFAITQTVPKTGIKVILTKIILFLSQM